MAIIKCKMCGGDLVLVEGSTVATCEFCGSQQTVPTADSEKKLTLFARANRLRAACDFDKAAGIYESIVADFPDEAEAYWGLVLCKYGIEYVDDPGTGKKIPTCHRSSFDSVMDDANFEQAIENADMAAQKVYRDEAKQFERIRKGILEVSSTEKPYDIFICYKETAPNGDRTLDSVLAQDLYSALTDKGYRVFFSRITLQGKLGEAFEPYIFAALNSAKVMLAVGTSYEYYNAVWVKNEWSRYLKICEADKSKHLIPCYKDLDPEDMPKEFNHLQGADLGKMGAIQDILFNMEKYIPLKKQNTTVIHEQVVVGGSGNNKIASLLDRGNMALEDGDWAKADSFFEDVLNNDSKNAQAYLGKTLATEKCRTIDAFARKRKDASQNVTSERLYIKVKTHHIDEMVARYTLPSYLEADSIRNLYDFDLGYPSDVPERQQQYRNEERYWADHKWLSKAEKFAVGAVAEHLETEKKALFSALANRVKQAEAAEAAAKKDVQARYEAHLLRADEQAEALFEDGRKRREADYQKLLMLAKNSADVTELTKTAERFDELGDYQDSKNLAGHCRNRAKEENERLLAKEKELHLEEVRLQKARIRRNRILALCAIGVLVTLTTLAYHVVTVIIPNNKYNSAIEMMANGEYEDAISVFSSLDGYSDSVNQIEICRTSILNEQYEDAIALFNAGSYTDAINAFTALNGYLDSKDWIEKCNLCIMDDNYNSALAMLDAGNYDAAFALLEELGDYKDSSEKILEYKYKVAETLSQNDRKYEAAILFGKIREYEDSWDQSMALWNEIAKRYTIGVSFHTVAVKSDGTVLATGSNDYGQCDVGSWTDIVAICAGYHHTVGLKADGTVVAVGSNDCGQCDVSNWKDIVAISAGDDFTLGLKADGTVVAVGSNSNGECDVSEWTDVVAISAGEFHTVALKSDGTVVATGYNYGGLCDVDNWTDITAISASDCNTVGLKSDGTVVRVGDNDYHQQNVDTWTNIIAITTGSDYIFGLLPDGTVINTADDDFSNQCITKDWTDIVAISAGVINTIGLKADGTVLVAGNDLLGTNNVSDWTNIKIP